MQNHPKSKCTSASHQILVDNAKNRLNHLQERFSDLQAARKQGRAGDVALLEEQVYQSLREWQAELTTPSPASSLLGGTIGSFSDEIARLLQLYEEEDDATSALAEPAALKLEPFTQSLCTSSFPNGLEHCLVNTEPQQYELEGLVESKVHASSLDNLDISNLDLSSQLDYHMLNLNQELNNGFFVKSDNIEEGGKDPGPNILPTVSPPPAAFLGPKCALWDCTRPAQGSQWCHDYCSSYHADLAFSEDPPGTTPILRPGGISLKDNLLLDALRAKSQGKNVGIPSCEGAASNKCPWNAMELFDLSLVEGETMREWLFFDKPRRAFESGNRKQRSLPDYSGRGWHESRKQVMRDYGGQKRSYYMDPQPPGSLEWHLYEYQINGFDACALYRVELKFVTMKRSPKGKITKDPLADIQKKMGRLTAKVPSDNSPPIKGKTNGNTGNSAENSMNSSETMSFDSSRLHNHPLNNPAGDQNPQNC